eukprot:1245573-Alexandrium_andersonii.AAC.1
MLGKVPNVESAIRSRATSAASRVNLNSTRPQMRSGFGRSRPELRGPRNGLGIDPPELPRDAFCTAVRTSG